MADNDTKLTPEQIGNWRRVLIGMIGPYAIIMPDEEIQAVRNTMQSWAESLPDEEELVPSNIIRTRPRKKTRTR